MTVSNGIFVYRTFCSFRDTNVALREVLLEDSRRKLQLVYEGDTLTDCIDESLQNNEDNICSMDLHTEGTEVSEASIEIVKNEGGKEKTQPELIWLASIPELRNRCSNVKACARNRLHQRHR